MDPQRRLARALSGVQRLDGLCAVDEIRSLSTATNEVISNLTFICRHARSGTYNTWYWSSKNTR